MGELHNRLQDPVLNTNGRGRNKDGTENRIYHRSPMQTEKFQPEDKQIMPETCLNEFPVFSIDPSVGNSRSASETDI